MKRKSRWFARWTSWGLFLGCGLSGLTGAHGQNYPPYQRGVASPYQQGQPAFTPVVGHRAATEGSPESRLQMAYLADPVTFPLNLKIHSTAIGLKVSGAVPNAAVKKRVLDIASQQVGRPVESSLTVVPGMLGRFAGKVAPAELESRAWEAIRKAVPDCAARIQVKADERGRVTLTGSVNSSSQKLIACQSLRQLPECTSVTSKLVVGGSSTALVGYAPASVPVKTPVREPYAAPIVQPKPQYVPAVPATVQQKKEPPRAVTVAPAFSQPVEPPSWPRMADPLPTALQVAPRPLAPEISKSQWTASPPALPAAEPAQGKGEKAIPEPPATPVAGASKNHDTATTNSQPQQVSQAPETMPEEAVKVPVPDQKDGTDLGKPYHAVAQVSWESPSGKVKDFPFLNSPKKAASTPAVPPHMTPLPETPAPIPATPPAAKPLPEPPVPIQVPKTPPAPEKPSAPIQVNPASVAKPAPVTPTPPPVPPVAKPAPVMPAPAPVNPAPAMKPIPVLPIPPQVMTPPQKPTPVLPPLLLQSPVPPAPLPVRVQPSTPALKLSAPAQVSTPVAKETPEPPTQSKLILAAVKPLPATPVTPQAPTQAIKPPVPEKKSDPVLKMPEPARLVLPGMVPVPESPPRPQTIPPGLIPLPDIGPGPEATAPTAYNQPTPPQPVAITPGSNPGISQVSPGAMKIFTNPTVQSVVPSPGGNLTLIEVKALVEKYCGKNARNVSVRNLPDGQLEVRLESFNETAASQVFDRIVNIPDLGPYRMKVKIDVGQ